MDNNPDIIEFYETLIDDSPDTVSEYVLLNQADAQLRILRPWEILKKLDVTQTRVGGESYLTAKTLPSDFHRPNKLVIGTGQPALKRIRFEEQHVYKTAPGLYFIDFANGQYYITDGTWPGTIYNYYFFNPGKLTADGANSTRITPIWPSDYWPMLAYKMAEIQMGGIDFDQIAAGSLPTWVRTYKDLLDGMTNWDAELKDNDILPRGYADDDSVPVMDLGLL